MRSSALIRLLVIGAITCAAGCASAGRQGAAHPVVTVEAEGMAPMQDDLQKARTTSLDEALRTALGLVVGVYITQESLVSQALLVEEEITSQTNGYVEKYEVIREWRDGDFYKTRVRASVRKEDIAEKIRSLKLEPKPWERPTVSVAVSDQIDGASSPSAFASTAIQDILVRDGFIVAAPGKADIRIEGKALSEFNTDRGFGGLVSYRGTANAQAVLASGDVVAAKTEMAGGADVTRPAAARASLERSAGKLGETLSAAIRQHLSERTRVQLNVSGIKSVNDLHNLVRSIRAIPLVKDCVVRSFEGKTADVDVYMRRGVAADLARNLESSAAFTVTITRLGARDITAAVAVK